jgi:hypothetical protein
MGHIPGEDASSESSSPCTLQACSSRRKLSDKAEITPSHMTAGSSSSPFLLYGIPEDLMPAADALEIVCYARALGCSRTWETGAVKGANGPLPDIDSPSAAVAFPFPNTCCRTCLGIHDCGRGCRAAPKFPVSGPGRHFPSHGPPIFAPAACAVLCSAAAELHPSHGTEPPSPGLAWPPLGPRPLLIGPRLRNQLNVLLTSPQAPTCSLSVSLLPLVASFPLSSYYRRNQSATPFS